ncbi:filamentous hemagglutinin N-terminal domain-containing protein [Spirulina major]|uniref:two-partner secretion domain-containing protein n=1 Tax=Spirulina major TaxID=270636 RepID=UPI000932DC0F|nr:filamentous hemagglutinin N-terminal domain-containing protein [Spirulina major]
MMRILNRVSLAIAVGTLGISGPASAQIVPDQTLGAEQSILNDTLIQGGAIRNTHLFHSFQEFNVGNTQRIDFANPTGITDIFSRVTGSNPSHIFGTLGVLGPANLTLLNPNGILFGPDAQLDLRGSFTATTAHRIPFSNGYEFGTEQPQSPPLLNIGVPLGLQYGTNPGNIENFAQLAAGQNLHLLGGDVILHNQLSAGGNLTLEGQGTVQIRDRTDQPFIAAAQGALTIKSDRIDIFALNHPESGLFSGSDMTLRSDNPIIGDAHYWSGGNFSVQNSDRSPGDLISPHDPVIRALGDVVIRTYIGTSLHLLAGGKVQLQSVQITGPDSTGNAIAPSGGLYPELAAVTLSNGTTITIDGVSQPVLDVRAGVQASVLAPEDSIGSNFTTADGTRFPTITTADIEIGVIAIADDGLILLTNRYKPNTAIPDGDITLFSGGLINAGTSTGNASAVVLDARRAVNIDGEINTSSTGGNAGNVSLLAADQMTIDGAIQAASSSGQGGDINLISADDMAINAELQATSGSGQGGNINLIAADGMAVNAAIQASSQTGDAGDISLTSSGQTTVNAELQATSGSGQGGNVHLSSDQLLLNAGLQTSSSLGTAGSVTLTASDRLDVNATIEAVSSSGQGGDINLISADDMAINAELQATSGSGQGGNINLIAADGMAVNAAIQASSQTGNAGDISLTSSGQTTVNADIQATSSSGQGGDIFLRSTVGGLTVNADLSTFAGGGDAGDIDLIADRGNVAIASSLIRADTLGAGQGGNVTLQAAQGQISIDDFSEVSSRTLGSGNGGMVDVNATNLRITSSSALYTTSTSSGRAGDININVTDAIQLDGGSIFANTFGGTGNAGNIDLKARTLLAANASRISAFSQGDGSGGTITVEIAEQVDLIGNNGGATGLYLGANATGDAGSLSLKTKRLNLTDGAQIFASTAGVGQAGSLDIRAAESIQIRGTTPNGFVSSQLASDTSGSGNAGNFVIQTARLAVLDGGKISASTNSFGQAGTMRVTASESLWVQGTGGNDLPSQIIFTSDGAGRAGGIEIKTGALEVRDRARITVSGTGSGISGDLGINATSINLLNQGQLQAFTEASAGGNIRIVSTDAITLRFNSEISAEAFGNSNGGNLWIETNGIIFGILSENSDIVASAVSGQGGAIFAKALLILGFREFQGQRTSASDFTADSLFGVDGVTSITVEDFQPELQLPTDFAAADFAPACAPRRPQQEANPNNTFHIVGLGGLQNIPSHVPNTSPPTIPWLTIQAEPAASPEEGPAIRVNVHNNQDDRVHQEHSGAIACYPLLLMD